MYLLPHVYFVHHFLYILILTPHISGNFALVGCHFLCFHDHSPYVNDQSFIISQPKVLLWRLRLLWRLIDENGSLIESPYKKVKLNTTFKKVEFPDDRRVFYATNIIAVEMYYQVNPDGRCDAIIEIIINFHQDPKSMLWRKWMLYLFYQITKCVWK